MSELIPEEWKLVSLNDICSKVTDGSHNPPKGTETGLPMLSAKNIHDGIIDFQATHRLISEDQFQIENKRTSISSGDILLTIVGTLGRVAVVPESFQKFTLQRSVAVLAAPCIHASFLGLALNDSSFQYQILSNAKGTAQKGIYLKKLRELIIPLPPLAEQKVIADKLDELLVQVEGTKARLDAIPAILKSFRQSVLAAAVCGKLTEEWRGETQTSAEDFIDQIKESRFKLWKETELSKYQEKEKRPPKNWLLKYKIPENNEIKPNLPSTWGCLSWGEISMWITYGFTKPMPHVDIGPLIITAKNVRHSEITLTGTHHTTEEAFQSLGPKDKPTEGDILIVKDGATTGRTSLAPVGIGDYCISQSVAVVWLKYSPINRKYLLWCVQSDSTQKRIQEVMAGMAMPHLSITDFGKMQVPIPPATEVDEIVRRVEDLFAFADKVEAQVNAAQARVNKLTQSILAKAFRGELTADWRAANPELISDGSHGNNSAASLLERIKAEREALAAVKKPTRKASAKALKVK